MASDLGKYEYQYEVFGFSRLEKISKIWGQKMENLRKSKLFNLIQYNIESEFFILRL